MTARSSSTVPTTRNNDRYPSVIGTTVPVLTVTGRCRRPTSDAHPAVVERVEWHLTRRGWRDAGLDGQGDVVLDQIGVDGDGGGGALAGRRDDLGSGVDGIARAPHAGGAG